MGISQFVWENSPNRLYPRYLSLFSCVVAQPVDWLLQPLRTVSFPCSPGIDGIPPHGEIDEPMKIVMDSLRPNIFGKPWRRFTHLPLCHPRSRHLRIFGKLKKMKNPIQADLNLRITYFFPAK